MAIAEVMCTCKACGTVFKHRHECYNRKDANDYEFWARVNIDLCPKCYAKQCRAEEAEKLAEFGAKLPKLVGTEKQIAWAEKLRRAAIESDINATLLMDDIDQLPELIATLNSHAAEHGEDDPDVINCRRAIHLVTETSAKWFIEHR